jgi:type II secretory pathway component PulF
MNQYEVTLLENSKIVKRKFLAKDRLKLHNLTKNNILDIKEIRYFNKTIFNNLNVDSKIRFFEELKTLLLVDTPIIIALNNIKMSLHNNKLSKSIEQLIISLKSGKSLHYAMKDEQELFGKMAVSLIKIGEENDKLIEFIEYVIKILETNKNNLIKIKKALTYPIITLFAMFGATVFVSLFLIPKFQMLYESSNKVLPTPTLILIYLNKFITHNYISIVVTILFSLLIFTYLYKFSKLKYYIDMLFFKFIPTREIFIYNQFSQFFLSLNILLNINSSIKKAMFDSIEFIKNDFISTKLKESYFKIIKGENISLAFEQISIFQTTTIGLLNTGVSSGSINNILLFISKEYQTKFNNANDKFILAIEPILISIIALLVLFLTLAILLPVWNFSSSASL